MRAPLLCEVTSTRILHDPCNDVGVGSALVSSSEPLSRVCCSNSPWWCMCRHRAGPWRRHRRRAPQRRSHPRLAATAQRPPPSCCQRSRRPMARQTWRLRREGRRKERLTSRPASGWRQRTLCSRRQPRRPRQSLRPLQAEEDWGSLLTGGTLADVPAALAKRGQVPASACCSPKDRRPQAAAAIRAVVQGRAVAAVM